MKEINIAETIIRKRKEKGLTQDELASYFGVSKAAISKWETGQSYPDITLLPIIASYFDISVDSLLGYTPQLSKEDIANLYKKYCDEFTKLEVNEVMKHIRPQVKKYHSCYEWLYYAALLYINHAMIADTPEATIQIYEEALALVQRIQKESDILALQKQAQSLEVYCYLVMNKPKEILVKLNDIETLQSNMLLANAFIMDGQTQKALQCVQVDVYQSVILLCNAYTLLLTLQFQEEKEFAYSMDTLRQFIQIFHVDKLNVGAVLSLYLAGMQGYVLQEKYPEAMELLEMYCELLQKTESFKPIYGEHFNLVEEWMNSTVISIDSPRNKKIIRQSALDAFENPVFEALHDLPKFQELHAKLKRLIERT